MQNSGDPRDFDIFIREGEQRMFWRHTNHGITVNGDVLRWQYEGHDRERKFGEIVSVHLSSSHVARHGDVYNCQVRFRDGDNLILYSTTDMGLPDDARALSYREFILALHAALAKSGESGIRFRAGMSEGKHTFFMVTAIAAALMFVVLPVGLFLILETSWHVLGLIVAGAGLMWPLWKHWQNNHPRDYAPDDLPCELIPG